MRGTQLRFGLVLAVSNILCRFGFAQRRLVRSNELFENHGSGEEAALSLRMKLIFAGISLMLVLVAGIVSGLTLGLMSMDMVDLEIMKRSGTEKDKKHATTIIPIVRNQHLLLVSLLLTNAFCMESLPLFLDRLCNPVVAVLLSLSLVLVFGEIVPQALCKVYGLAIGATLSWFVWSLIFVLYPIAWPISKVLDWALGHEETALFRRLQLRTLVELHASAESFGGELSNDEMNVMLGALDLSSKQAVQAMTPIDMVVMVPESAPLDDAFFDLVLDSGHSRVPVYRKERTNLVGVILVKELLKYRGLRPSNSGLSDNLESRDSAPLPPEFVRDLPLRQLPLLPVNMNMFELLRFFETGRAHMAALISASADHPPARPRADVNTNLSQQSPFSKPFEDLQGSPESKSGFGSPMPQQVSSPTSKLKPQKRPTKKGSGFHAWAGVSSIDADDLDNEHVLGVITIEDVLEELIRSEIVDETDQFVDNMRTLPISGQHQQKLNFAMHMLRNQRSSSGRFVRTASSRSGHDDQLRQQRAETLRNRSQSMATDNSRPSRRNTSECEPLLEQSSKLSNGS